MADSVVLMLLVLVLSTSPPPKILRHKSDGDIKLLVKTLAILPTDAGASCDHPDISVKYHISASGEVYGVRLANPTRDYVYLESIVHALAKWRYRPAVEDGLATISRNIEYTFRMRKDFSPCVYGHGENTQPNKALQLTLDPVTSLAAAKEAPASSAAELGS